MALLPCHLAKPKQDKRPEQRIEQEIVVDADDREERAMGWYSYLEEPWRFAFSAKCIAPRAVSPVRKGQPAEVVGLAPAQECEHEMFVRIACDQRTLAVPLAQLQAIPADKATRLAVEDGHYRVRQGYEF